MYSSTLLYSTLVAFVHSLIGACGRAIYRSINPVARPIDRSTYSTLLPPSLISAVVSVCLCFDWCTSINKIIDLSVWRRGLLAVRRRCFIFLCGVGLCVGGRAGGPVRGWVLLLVRERSERWGLRAGGIDCLLTCESRRRQHTSGCFLSLSLSITLSANTPSPASHSFSVCHSRLHTYGHTFDRAYF